MPQPLISMEVRGDEQLVRGFSRFTDKIKDMSPAWREMAIEFRKIEGEQFATEGGHGSGGWAPLAPTTLARKERGGYPSQILVRTRRLERSLTSQTADSIEVIRPLEMRYGTTSPGAKYHQDGTRYMPTRPIIKLNEDDKTRLTKIIHKFLVSEMQREFGSLMPTMTTGSAHLGGI